MTAEARPDRKQEWVKPELRRIEPTPEIIAAFAQANAGTAKTERKAA